MKQFYLIITSILLVVCACKEKDEDKYYVPPGEGSVPVCKIKNPTQDLLWIDKAIDTDVKPYWQIVRYVSVYFGIFDKSILKQKALDFYVSQGFFKSRNTEQVVIFKLSKFEGGKADEIATYWLYNCEGKFLLEWELFKDGDLYDVTMGLKEKTVIKENIDLHAL